MLHSHTYRYQHHHPVTCHYQVVISILMVQTLHLEIGALNEEHHLEQIVTEAREVIHAPGAMATLKSISRQCSAQHFLRGGHCQDRPHWYTLAPVTDCQHRPQYAFASVTAHSRHQPCWFVRSSSRWTSSARCRFTHAHVRKICLTGLLYITHIVLNSSAKLLAA